MGEMRALRAADQLAAILDSADLPPRLRAVGERVRERLAHPVRIAVVGRAGSGRRRLLAGLLGDPVLPAMVDLPPLDLRLGDGLATEAVTAEGATCTLDAAALARADPGTLALLQMTAPLPLLEKAQFVVVPLEEDAEAAAAALAWACRRADMLLWCAPGLDGPDAALWPRLPEALQDHAFLAITGAASGATGSGRWSAAEAACHFREVRDLSPGAGAAGRIAKLRSALLTHLSAARREDLEGALVFLDQHLTPDLRAQLGRPAPHAGASAALAPAPPPAPTSSCVASSATAPTGDAGGADARAEADAAPASGAEVEIVALLAERAAALAPLCAAGPPAPSAALQGCADALEAAAARAGSEGGALGTLLAEAEELMLLLRLEATQAAVSDAVALLLQVRRECEACAAA
jgi:hypothetical protein